MSGKYLLYLALSGFKADMGVWKMLASQWAPKDQAFAVHEENRHCSKMNQDKNYKSYWFYGGYNTIWGEEKLATVFTYFTY